MDYIMINRGGQEVRCPCVELLRDERYEWRDRKMRTIRLAALYDKAGYPDYAERARTCATWLQYKIDPGGSKQLSAVNFCQLRLCPMCTSRRARRAAYKLSRVLDLAESEHGCKYLFLTLTMANVDGEHLGAALGQLTDAWQRLLGQRQLERTVMGWFRAIEITRGDDRYHKDRKTGRRVYRADNGYHPHLHVILAVEPDYFGRAARQSGKYLNQAELIERWQKALRVDYKPSVRIQMTKGKGHVSGGRAAAVEAAKYAVKDEDYIDPGLTDDQAVEIVRDYTTALHRRRLTAFGGWLKDAARALDAADLDDGDLIHVDEDAVREDVAELIETYSWSFGVGDYVLTSREVNPLIVRRGQCK